MGTIIISPTDEPIDLTFHGGEPLLAGKGWYARHLPVLRSRFGKRLKVSVQSNLWLLDDGLCRLFNKYEVSLGTSLDGPESINDRQRGEGYFGRTMAGIETARRNGMSVGVICTFTRLSAPHYQRVLDFFLSEHLSFGVHAAVSMFKDPRETSLAMSPEAHTDLFIRLFDAYQKNITRIQITNFDAMIKSVSAGSGGLCTFTDCLGRYLAIGPQGHIYPCNRFAGHSEWQLGSVLEVPDQKTLARSGAWTRLQERERAVHKDCGDCNHLGYCKGGCVYNVVTAGGDLRDPHCTAYKRLFDHITDRALEQVFSDKNLDVVLSEGPGKHGLMRKGGLLQIMRDGPHPRKVARHAREVVAAVALAVSSSPQEALHKLDLAGLITRPELAIQSLTELRRRLDTQSQQRLVNIYLHSTYTCNLRCTHCYARSGPDRSQVMAVDRVVRLVSEAGRAGFRKVVMTGGEPTMHPQRTKLLEALIHLRKEIQPTQIVLRTNLAYRLTPSLVEYLAHSADQVVVSVDGDEASHDARRGAGSYARTVANLRTLLEAKPTAEIGITAVLTAGQMGGAEGDAVRALGDELDVRVRLKSVLPLGRGTSLGLTPAFYSSLDDGAEAIAYGAYPAATCGLGMNLYVGPGGECYPCYALMGERHNLSNAFDNGLASVLEKNDAYRQVTVDSNRQCRHCALRYMCGGFCRAWGVSDDPDAPPIDCAALRKRASRLLVSALDVLEMRAERWLEAALPFPDALPSVR